MSRFLQNVRSTQWKGYRHPQEGGKESPDREVWILIPLQMAGSVWKSKHFKMKSSNDWSNDHEHTVGKHIQVDDQPHKKLSTLLKILHLFVTETLRLTPQNLSILTEFALKSMIHTQTITKNKKRIFPFLSCYFAIQTVVSCTILEIDLWIFVEISGCLSVIPAIMKV